MEVGKEKETGLEEVIETEIVTETEIIQEAEAEIEEGDNITPPKQNLFLSTLH